MIACGIDPGLTGGIAFLEDGRIAARYPLPVVGRQVDVRATAVLLGVHEPGFTWIEQQSIRPRQAGALTIGTNYGRLLAVLELDGWPHRDVSPAAWSRAAGIPAKISGGPRREAAWLVARRLWGDQIGALKPAQDGMVAALLIARYGGSDGRGLPVGRGDAAAA
jgi:hypothetical protein